MKDKFYPGLEFSGFCCGYFGRDSYGSKVIEHVGSDYLVYREDGNVEKLDIDSDYEWEQLWKGVLDCNTHLRDGYSYDYDDCEWRNNDDWEWEDKKDYNFNEEEEKWVKKRLKGEEYFDVYEQGWAIVGENQVDNIVNEEFN